LTRADVATHALIHDDAPGPPLSIREPGVSKPICPAFCRGAAPLRPAKQNRKFSGRFERKSSGKFSLEQRTEN
jgi:hypothetical protein